ncbi:hypothetical protein B7755_049210 [Streptomyces sp. NBS 14/10]|uniref:hypothetical protein n=1 Tax=Streptomyces sp. NBS 14/10 TaxID=1945643 RepID=UPI0015C6374D|nr:hypothetical protein [Streptomyces sp. NBS 14/10]KAK1185368.1 hypothetical protein B7755_049210 [Streptomyces sp. NBS 14/10]
MDEISGKGSVRTHEQPYTPQGGQRQPVQQRRQERPIAGREPDLVLAELAFQHGDLVAQGEDLRVLVRPVIGSRRSIANVFVTPR